MSDSEIIKLCKDIYRKHKTALDLIYEHRPDQQAEIYDFLLGLINSNPDLVLDHSTKSYIRFIPSDWEIPNLKKSKGWTPSKLIILFEFTNSANSLRLKITIGPGPIEIRQKLLDMALQNDPPLHSPYQTLNQMYNNIYTRSVLSPKDYEIKEIDELTTEIKEKWANFIAHELPDIQRVMMAGS